MRISRAGKPPLVRRPKWQTRALAVELRAQGLTLAQIAYRLQVGRDHVRRLLKPSPAFPSPHPDLEP